MYETSFHGEEKLENLRFLVTGGAGFIGSHLVEYLIKHNAGKVTVLDDLSTGDFDNIKPFTDLPNFRFIRGDIRIYDTCKFAMEGVDYVLHEAALGSVPRSLEHPDQTNAVNVSGFLNMIQAAKESKVKRFVYASSSSVYGDSQSSPKFEDQTGRPLSPYAVSKCTNELYSHVYWLNFGLEVIGLRYFNVFGPRQNPNGAYAAVIPKFINMLMEGKQVEIHGDGEQTRDFTFVENVVQANMKALFTKEEGALDQAYNVAVGDSFSVKQMFEFIRELLGVNAEAKHVETRKGDVRNSLADISKSQKFLHYSPGVRFKDGLEQTVAYFKTLATSNSK